MTRTQTATKAAPKPTPPAAKPGPKATPTPTPEFTPAPGVASAPPDPAEPTAADVAPQGLTVELSDADRQAALAALAEAGESPDAQHNDSDTVVPVEATPDAEDKTETAIAEATAEAAAAASDPVTDTEAADQDTADTVPADDPKLDQNAQLTPGNASLEPPAPRPEPPAPEPPAASLIDAAVERLRVTERGALVRDVRGAPVDPDVVFSAPDSSGQVRCLVRLVQHSVATVYDRPVRVLLVAAGQYLTPAAAAEIVRLIKAEDLED